MRALSIAGGEKLSVTLPEFPSDRTAIRAILEREVYGPTPAPSAVRATIREIRPFGTQGRRAAVDVEAGPVRIAVALYLPPGPPAPVFFGPNFAGNSSIDPDPAIPMETGWKRPEHADLPRGAHEERWPMDAIVAAGFAGATWYDGDVCSDDPALCAARGRELGGSFGAIALWAWGFSRVREALAQTGLVRAERAIAVGHSRHGKAAIWAVANDPAIAGLIANNSGAGGSRPFRWPEGETIAQLFDRFPHWFAPALAKFAGRENALTFDQHAALALAAPRPLYLASARDDLWAGPKGEEFAFETIRPYWPKADIGRHVRDGGHGITRADWTRFLEFAARDRTPTRSFPGSPPAPPASGPPCPKGACSRRPSARSRRADRSPASCSPT
jgi:hypothetical protein